MAFWLKVLGFAPGDWIPRQFACEGKNVSPALEWGEAPSHAKSFVLIVDDPDAPMGTWTHWTIWDIPAGTNALEEGVQSEQAGVSGLNDFGKPGYGGPCPPKGRGPHRYFFRLFALDVASIQLAAGSKRSALDRAMRGHVLAEIQLMGRYLRQ